jgi:dGTPase
MEWQKLLSSTRLGRGDDAAGYGRDKFRRDFDSIIFSSAFRRMQDKTQVFPLARNDYVRTRLTHSLEVSSVGRSLGTIAGKHILDATPDLAKAGFVEADFGSVVAAACLIHDIGNPPFGHTGEDAIQEWFRSSTKAQPIIAQLGDELKHDFLRFEGNAQGFRVATRLHDPSNAGMRLTCATLAASIKYPQTARARAELDGGTITATQKKHNFFEADFSTYAEIGEHCGLKGEHGYHRHPLAYLVEAADDICYHIIDIEDGFRTGCLEFDEVQLMMLTIANAGVAHERKVHPESPTDKSSREREITRLRGAAINNCIQRSIDCFNENSEALLSGAFNSALLDEVGEICDAMEKCKELCEERVYPSRAVAGVETMGYRVLWELLDLFVPTVAALVTGKREDIKPSLRQKTLTYLLPEQARTNDTLYGAVLGVTDYVAGMTDTFALSVYHELTGYNR